MSQPTSLPSGASLIERAAEIYDFAGTAPRARPAPASPIEAPIAPVSDFADPGDGQSEPSPLAGARPQIAPRLPVPCARVAIDRALLAEHGFISPDAPTGVLAEEFRIIKRQLLLAARSDEIDVAKRRSILVCSAASGEGKTFAAINLALSMAGEQDQEVLLVDGDFAKPEIPALLGIEPGPGLIDAIADPSADPERFVVDTDVPGLSFLCAGRQANNATELVASARTRAVLGALGAANPRRIIIFDSPPALLASPASVLAAHVGQVLMVVRADRTSETDLREAVNLLSACDHINLMLNAASLVITGRRFGSYYGYGG